MYIQNNTNAKLHMLNNKNIDRTKEYIYFSYTETNKLHMTVDICF